MKAKFVKFSRRTLRDNPDMIRREYDYKQKEIQDNIDAIRRRLSKDVYITLKSGVVINSCSSSYGLKYGFNYLVLKEAPRIKLSAAEAIVLDDSAYNPNSDEYDTCRLVSMQEITEAIWSIANPKLAKEYEKYVGLLIQIQEERKRFNL